MKRKSRSRSRAALALALACVLARVSCARGGFVAKAIVAYGKDAVRRSRAREKINAPAGSALERFVDDARAWTRRATTTSSNVRDELPSAANDDDDDEDEDEGEKHRHRHRRHGDDDETRASEGGVEDAARERSAGERASDGPTDADRATSIDGDGLGMRVLNERTFDDVFSRANARACEATGDRADANASSFARLWLVAACARRSLSCRALAPRLALLSVDSAFAPVNGELFQVAWVDCSSDDARAWCAKRFRIAKTPTVIAMAPNDAREMTYDGTFEGDVVENIRDWALAFARKTLRTSNDERRATEPTEP